MQGRFHDRTPGAEIASETIRKDKHETASRNLNFMIINLPNTLAVYSRYLNRGIASEVREKGQP
jgi:pantothenate kinase